MTQNLLDLEAGMKIRVIVLPVGNIDPQKFHRYENYIQNHSTVELHELTIDTNIIQKSTMKHRNWVTDRLNFDFLSLHMVASDDWRDMFFHRRVLGVIGILDCAQWIDLRFASQEFRTRLEDDNVFEDVVAQLCIAVEPGPDHKDLEGDSNNLVLLPNQSEDYIKFYMKGLVHDLAVKLLKGLHTSLEKAEIPLLVTPHDANQEQIESNKKLRAARFMKQQGDLCLLLGSPQDSEDYYTKAIDQTKSTQDSLWTAGAIEGIASAKLVSLKRRPSDWKRVKDLGNTECPELNEIITKLNEALDFYAKKSATDLHIECIIKLSRIYMIAGDKLQASNLIMKAYGETEALSIQEKITLTSAIALLYKDLGLIRKFSFFLRETALLCKKIVLPQRAYYLLKMVAPYYQVRLPFSEEDFTAINFPKKMSRRELLFQSGIVWKFIHATLFDDLIEVASEMKDPKIPIRYLVAYLSTLGRHLSLEKQQDLSKQILKQTKRFPVMTATGSPGLLTVLPVTHISEVNFGGNIEDLVGNDDGGPSGPFLYRPKRAILNLMGPETPVVSAAKNTPVIVRVPLVNHFHFPLTLFQMEVAATGITCKPVKELTFEPQQVQHVDFTVIADELVLIKEASLRYRAFNCVHTQPIRLDTHLKILPVLSTLSITSISPGGTKLKLFNGQERTIDLKFVNTGTASIDFMNFDVEEVYDKTDDESLFKERHKMIVIDKTEIEKNIPLKPKSSFIVPITVRAHVGCRSAKLNLFYGNTESVKYHQRKLEFPFQFTVMKGLQLFSYDILDCTVEALRHLKSVSSSHYIIGEEDLFKENVCPKEFCMVSLDVINQTVQPFYLECSKDPKNKTSLFGGSSITIDPFCVQRILVGVKRMEIAPEQMPPIDSAMKKFLIKEKHVTEAQFDSYRALQVYRDYLVDQIAIRWQSVTDNCNGILRLDGLRLSEQQLERLRRPVIDVRISMVTGQNEDNGKNEFKVHSLLKLESQVTIYDPARASDDIRISLLPLRLLSESSFTWINKVSDLQVKGNPSLKFSVCFHEQGTFQLVAQCKDIKNNTSYWSPVLEINVV